MALDPARRRGNLPTGDLKARIRISPGLPTILASSMSSNLLMDIEHASVCHRASPKVRLLMNRVSVDNSDVFPGEHNWNHKALALFVPSLHCQGAGRFSLLHQ
jgi:hypothetical protein